MNIKPKSAPNYTFQLFFEKFWQKYCEEISQNCHSQIPPFIYQKINLFYLNSFLKHKFNYPLTFGNLKSKEEKVKKVSSKTLSTHHSLKIYKKNLKNLFFRKLNIQPTSAPNNTFVLFCVKFSKNYCDEISQNCQSQIPP